MVRRQASRLHCPGLAITNQCNIPQVTECTSTLFPGTHSPPRPPDFTPASTKEYFDGFAAPRASYMGSSRYRRRRHFDGCDVSVPCCGDPDLLGHMARFYRLRPTQRHPLAPATALGRGQRGCAGRPAVRVRPGERDAEGVTAEILIAGLGCGGPSSGFAFFPHPEDHLARQATRPWSLGTRSRGGVAGPTMIRPRRCRWRLGRGSASPRCAGASARRHPTPADGQKIWSRRRRPCVDVVLRHRPIPRPVGTAVSVAERAFVPTGGRRA